MNRKQSTRLRRLRKTRARIRRLNALRLCVYRSPRHIYAQVIDSSSEKILASASTLETSLKTKISYGGNIEAAKQVGQCIAERAKSAGVTKVAFDRSGYKYHGRVKALADAARENGLSL